MKNLCYLSFFLFSFVLFQVSCNSVIASTADEGLIVSGSLSATLPRGNVVYTPPPPGPIAISVPHGEYSDIDFDKEFSFAVGDAFAPGAYNPSLKEIGIGEVGSVLNDPSALNFEWFSGVSVPVSIIWGNGQLRAEGGSGQQRFALSVPVDSINGVYFSMWAGMPFQDPKIELTNIYYNGVFVAQSNSITSFGFLGYKLIDASPGRLDFGLSFRQPTDLAYGGVAHDSLYFQFGTTAVPTPEPTSAMFLAFSVFLLSGRSGFRSHSRRRSRLC